MGAEVLGAVPRLLMTTGPLTAEEMFDEMRGIYSMKNIMVKIHNAKKRRKVHVVNWVWGNTVPRRMRAVFAFGPGRNIPRPPPKTKTEWSRERRALLKARSAHSSIFSYAASIARSGGEQPSI